MDSSDTVLLLLPPKLPVGEDAEFGKAWALLAPGGGGRRIPPAPRLPFGRGFEAALFFCKEIG